MNVSNSLLELQEQVLKLDQRVERIEREIRLEAPLPNVAEVAPPQELTLMPPTSGQPAVAFGTAPSPSIPAQNEPLKVENAAPIPSFPSPEAPVRSASWSLGEWENLIGGKWALWVGSLCLFLAIASFLAYTWATLPPPPPWAKVAMGMGVGAVLILAGGFLRPRAQRHFSEGLSGAGLAICYLSLWAGGQHFAVFSPSVSFLGMACLTALGVTLALRTDALSLSVLSAIGGFLTPILIGSSGGASSFVPFLSYLSLLNAGLLGAALVKRWRGLVWLCFAATFLLLCGWAVGADLNSQRGVVFGCFSLLWVLFAGAAIFPGLLGEEETSPEDLVLLFATTSLYALAGFSLLRPVTTAFPALFPLALSLIFGASSWAISRFAPWNRALRLSAGGLSLLALTIAVPVQWQQSGLIIGWAAEAGTLLFLSGRLDSLLLRRAGQIVWAATAIPLLVDFSRVWPAHPNFQSFSPMPFALCLLVTAFCAWDARHRAQNAGDADDFEAAYVLFALGGGAWLLGQEIYRALVVQRASAPAAVYLLIAVVVGFYALISFTLGLKWRHETLRLGALGLAVGGAYLAAQSGLESSNLGWTPLWNARFAAISLSFVTLALLSCALKLKTDVLSAFEQQIAGGWVVATALSGLWGVSVELFFAFSHGATLAGPRVGALVFSGSMLWNLSAALFLWLGCRWKQESLRVAALGVGSAALFALLCAAITPVAATMTPWRVAAFGVALATLGWSQAELRRHATQLSVWERVLPRQMLFVGLFLLLWLVTQESYEICRTSAPVLGPNWKRWAQMMVSLSWSLFGSLLLWGGIAWRSQSARLAALGLLSATVVKVFLLDLSFLNGPARVLSLGGLGIALIFISWLYSRFGSDKMGSEATVPAPSTAQTPAGTL